MVGVIKNGLWPALNSVRSDKKWLCCSGVGSGRHQNVMSLFSVYFGPPDVVVSNPGG